MSLTNKQKNKLLIELSNAFVYMRSLTCKSQQMTEDKLTEVHNIADRLHNIPKLLATQYVDIDQLTFEINIKDDEFRKRALKILTCE